MCQEQKQQRLKQEEGREIYSLKRCLNQLEYIQQLQQPKYQLDIDDIKVC